MRRIALFCALCASLTAAVFGATAGAMPSPSTMLARAVVKRKSTAVHRTKKAGRRHSTLNVAAATSSAGDPVLFGDRAIESGLDSNVAGWPEAFPFADANTGSVSSITVYVDSHNRATTLIAGLYSDNDGKPGSLLSTGSLTSPKAASWNRVPVSSAAVQSGNTYWIAILGRGGTLYFRDRNGGSCRSQNATQMTLRALTSSWSPGPSYPTCALSAVVGGTLTPQPTTSTTTTTSTANLPPLLTPVNALPPTISGTPTDGQTLNASTGTWLNSPTAYAYQWQDCDSSGANCASIATGTSSSYTLADSDIGHTIRVVVTASNSAGSGSGTSSQTAAVAAPPAPTNTAGPTVSGAPVQGQALSTSTGSWTNNPESYSYAWQDCNSSGASCTNISGAASSSYALVSHDVGHTIRAVVTATNAGGAGSGTSTQTAVVTTPPTAPTNSGLPQVSGTPTQGDTLTTNNGSWNGNPTGYTYAWEDCNTSGASCTTIAHATSSSYTLAASDVGDTIRSVVTASNGAGSSSPASSAQTTVVQAAATPPPAMKSAPTVTGTPTQGDTLTTSNGSWTGSPTYTYAWQDCNSSGADCSNIAGATSSSYTLQASDVNDMVAAVVTATNSGGSANGSSAAVGPVASSGGGGGGGGTVPCALTHAAGADPTNSCWATHTGVQGATGYTEAQIKANPSAVGFTKYNGDMVITASNTTISHEWINGCVEIADGANNTTITDSLITPNGDTCSGDNAGGSAINTGQGANIGKNTLIEDTTVDGGTTPNGDNSAGMTVDAGEVLRVNISGFTRMLLSDSNTAQYPALFQDDYVHSPSGCVHDDGTWFDSSSYVTLEHSYVLMGDPAGSGCTTAALSGGSDYGPQDHVTYDSNYADGADGENVHTGCGSTYMTITNNAIDNGAAKDASDGGYQSLTGNAWSGNYSVDDNTGANRGSWGPFAASC
jgi:hypothetical protein